MSVFKGGNKCDVLDLPISLYMFEVPKYQEISKILDFNVKNVYLRRAPILAF
jgi:hypothetical protein